MDKISVIIPVYNTQEYLARCLDSVLSQTYENLEIILVDDGSSDSSGIICDRFAETDARIRVIHQQNGGVGKARNAGLDIADGDYIAFVDADDWLEPEMLEKLLKNARSADAAVTICGAWFHTPNGNKQNRVFGNDGEMVDAKTALINYFARNFYGRALWNKLFRAALLKGIRFDTDIHYYEDSLFLSRVLIRQTERRSGRVLFFGEPLYHYCIGNAGSSIRSYDRYRTSVTAAKRICDVFREAGAMDLTRLAEFKVSFMAVNTCRQALLNDRKKEAGTYRYIAASYLKKTLFCKDVLLREKIQVLLALISPVHGVNAWLSIRNRG